MQSEARKQVKDTADLEMEIFDLTAELETVDTKAEAAAKLLAAQEPEAEEDAEPDVPAKKGRRGKGS